MEPTAAQQTGGTASATAPGTAAEPQPKPTGMGGPEDPYSNGTNKKELKKMENENLERKKKRHEAREKARLRYHTCGNLECAVMRLPPWLPRPPERLQEEFRGDRQSLGHLFPSSRRIVLQEDDWPMKPIETGDGSLLFSQAPAFFYGLTANDRKILLKGYPHEWLASGEGAPSCSRAANICHKCLQPSIIALTLTMSEARQPAMVLLGEGPLEGRDLQCLRGQRLDGSGLPYRVPQKQALGLFTLSLMREVGYLDGGGGGGGAGASTKASEPLDSAAVQKKVKEFVDALVPEDGADGEGLETRWPSSPPPSPTKRSKVDRAALENRSAQDKTEAAGAATALAGQQKEEKEPAEEKTPEETKIEEIKKDIKNIKDTWAKGGHPSCMEPDDIKKQIDEIKVKIGKLQPEALNRRRDVMEGQLALEWRAERARLLKSLCRQLQLACALKGTKGGRALATSGRSDKDEHRADRWPAYLDKDEEVVREERKQMLRQVASTFLKEEHMMIEPDFLLTATADEDEKTKREKWWAKKLPADVLQLCEHLAQAAAKGGLELLAKEWRPKVSDHGYFKDPCPNLPAEDPKKYPPSWFHMDDSKLSAKFFLLPKSSTLAKS